MLAAARSRNGSLAVQSARGTRSPAAVIGVGDHRMCGSVGGRSFGTSPPASIVSNTSPWSAVSGLGVLRRLVIVVRRLERLLAGIHHPAERCRQFASQGARSRWGRRRDRRRGHVNASRTTERSSRHPSQPADKRNASVPGSSWLSDALRGEEREVGRGLVRLGGLAGKGWGGRIGFGPDDFSSNRASDRVSRMVGRSEESVVGRGHVNSCPRSSGDRAALS